jgi:hypothetical protein
MIECKAGANQVKDLSSAQLYGKLTNVIWASSLAGFELPFDPYLDLWDYSVIDSSADKRRCK